MYTRTVVLNARSLLGAAVIACTLSAGAAEGRDVTVAIHVNAQGLDLSQPAGAEKFYARLRHAAYVVCTHGNQVSLEPAANPKGCYEKALGDAIRSVRLPLVTQVYLATHTLGQAAALGIDVPAQLAAK
jgi:UrcA family protein